MIQIPLVMEILYFSFSLLFTSLHSFHPLLLLSSIYNRKSMIGLKLNFDPGAGDIRAPLLSCLYNIDSLFRVKMYQAKQRCDLGPRAY